MINLKVKTLDSQTYDFSVDDEITVRQFKETIAEKTSISADLQRIIYCGRVLVDEKLLKEYDVNGKVVHVVERPPPSSRTSTNTTNTTGTGRREGAQIRGSPIFRALDGMVVGAMTIPVNGGQTQTNIPPLNPSSSFCMNRITVARHMLDCANNIAAFLENPERGLNNSSLDILTQGRWTMESTVVEVGISAASNVDFTQNQTQNIMEAFRGAVSAALRQNGHPNVTVLQLPTVFGSNGSVSAGQPQTETDANTVSIAAAATTSLNDTDTTTTTIQSSSDGDISIEINNDEINAAIRAAADGVAAATNATPVTAQDTRNSGNNSADTETRDGSRSHSSPINRSRSRQRTGTRVLAEVVQNMRVVQTRLEPFVQQYYDILQNDPQFEESDTASRENAQRIFDRVSEALHYMSHAQHAISDLMLDLSQNSPRYLCCRPILVEQSGFVSSNNSLASFLNDGVGGSNANGNSTSGTPGNNGSSNTANGSRQQDLPPPVPIRFGFPFRSAAGRSSAAAPGNSVSVGSSAAGAAAATNLTNIATATPDNSSNTSSATTPTADQSASETPTTTVSATSVAAGNTVTAASGDGVTDQHDPQIFLPRLRQILTSMGGDRPPPLIAIPSGFVTSNQQNPDLDNIESNDAQNSQLQVARLIQAVVNSAPLDADLHVQINTPNLLSFGIPRPAPSSTENSGQQSAADNGASNTGAVRTQQQQTTTQTTSGSQSSSSSSGTDSDSNQPRVTTATHPTTSTQTRSTARPQVHIANVPSNWNARVIPANMLSSFDRFLPCSSHHIRDSENGNNEMNQNHAGGGMQQQNIMPNVFYRARPQVRRGRPQANLSSSATRSNSASARIIGSLGGSNGGNNTSNGGGITVHLQQPQQQQQQNQQPPSSTGSSRYSSAEDIQSLSSDEFNISINLFGSNLTLRDLIEIVPSPNLLNRIRTELLTYIIDNFFSGSTITENNMNVGINNLIQMLNDALIFLPQFDLPDYDARASIENCLRNSLPFIINLIYVDDTHEFGTRLLRELMQLVERLFVILVTCIGRNNTELYLNQIAQMAIASNNAGEQEPLRALQRHLMSAVIRHLDIITEDSNDIQRYLVMRRRGPVPPIGQRINTVMPMETDEIQVSPIIPIRSSTPNSPVSLQDTTSLPIPNPINTDVEALPIVEVGSEPWHSNFPSTWLPIITRDIERQRRQTIQTPFSDAYISGMSAKRRKLVTNTKTTEVPVLVAEGIKRAIQVSGIPPPPHQQQIPSNNINNPLTSSGASSSRINDDISMAIASDSITQASYCEALRTSVQDRLKTDPNFVPEKFPNSTKYFSK